MNESNGLRRGPVCVTLTCTLSKLHVTSFSCRTEPRAELLCVVLSSRTVKALIAIKPGKTRCRAARKMCLYRLGGGSQRRPHMSYLFQSQSMMCKSQSKLAVQPCLQAMSVVLAEHQQNLVLWHSSDVLYTISCVCRVMLTSTIGLSDDCVLFNLEEFSIVWAIPQVFFHFSHQRPVFLCLGVFRFPVTWSWVSVWLFCKPYVRTEQQAGGVGNAGLFAEIKLWHLVWFD